MHRVRLRAMRCGSAPSWFGGRRGSAPWSYYEGDQQAEYGNGSIPPIPSWPASCAKSSVTSLPRWRVAFV
jgi:hypothetical protein